MSPIAAQTQPTHTSCARDGSDIRYWFDQIRFAPGGRLPAAK